MVLSLTGAPEKNKRHVYEVPIKKQEQYKQDY